VPLEPPRILGNFSFEPQLEQQSEQQLEQQQLEQQGSQQLEQQGPQL
jgi:hypothetical protein